MEDKFWVCFHFGRIVVFSHNALPIKEIRSFWQSTDLALFGFVLALFLGEIVVFGLKTGILGVRLDTWFLRLRL